MNKQEEDMKEDFCSLCLVAPLAFVGAGTTMAGTTVSQSHKKWKKTLLISGVLTIVLSAMILIYYFLFKRDCKECRLN